jgi:ABC-type multidrug transport system fused ATPase/permease subunit
MHAGTVPFEVLSFVALTSRVAGSLLRGRRIRGRGGFRERSSSMGLEMSVSDEPYSPLGSAGDASGPVDLFDVSVADSDELALARSVLGPYVFMSAQSLKERPVGGVAVVDPVMALHTYAHVRAASSMLYRHTLKAHAGTRRRDSTAVRCRQMLEEWTAALLVVARSACFVHVTRRLGDVDRSVVPHPSVAAAFDALTIDPTAVGANGRNLIEDLPEAQEMLEAARQPALAPNVAAYFEKRAARRLERAVSRHGVSVEDDPNEQPLLKFREFADLLPVLWADEGQDGFHEFFVTMMETTIRVKTKRNLRCFLRHVLSAARASVVSTVLSAVLAFINGRIQVTGMVLRAAIEKELIDTRAAPHVLRRLDRVYAVVNGLQDTLRRRSKRYRILAPLLSQPVPNVVILIAAELVRCAGHAAMRDVLDRALRRIAAHLRESLKSRLHFALARLPMGFFDTTDSEKIAEILNYPNDLEGVDMKLATAITSASQVLWAGLGALALVRRPAVAVSFAGVAVTMRFVESRLQRYARRLNKQQPDWEEFESAAAAASPPASGGDNAALRALSSSAYALQPEPTAIVAAHPGAVDWTASDAQLQQEMHRPYRAPGACVLVAPSEMPFHAATLRAAGADVEQVVRWHQMLRYATTEQVLPPFRRCLRWARRAAGPALNGVLMCLKFLNPLVAVTVVNRQLAAQGKEQVPATVALELYAAVLSVVEVAQMLSDVRDLVLMHAHKAHTLDALTDPAVWEHRPAETAKSIRGGFINCVVLRDVDFVYPSRPDECVFRGLSMQFPFPTGAFVVIQGPNGSGKSTLLRLLMRLYEPQLGDIEVVVDVNESDTVVVPLRDIDLPLLRRDFFAYVPQASVLFDKRTVAENITLIPDAPGPGFDALLGQCADVAQCDGFIERWPEGYATLLGSDAITPSGGELQKIAIARGLYRQAQILLLDEPTNNLDKDSKFALLNSLTAYIRDPATPTRCVVCVTHDEDVLAYADIVKTMGDCRLGAPLAGDSLPSESGSSHSDDVLPYEGGGGR